MYNTMGLFQSSSLVPHFEHFYQQLGFVQCTQLTTEMISSTCSAISDPVLRMKFAMASLTTTYKLIISNKSCRKLRKSYKLLIKPEFEADFRSGSLDLTREVKNFVLIFDSSLWPTPSLVFFYADAWVYSQHYYVCHHLWNTVIGVKDVRCFKCQRWYSRKSCCSPAYSSFSINSLIKLEK